LKQRSNSAGAGGRESCWDKLRRLSFEKVFYWKEGGQGGILSPTREGGEERVWTWRRSEPAGGSFGALVKV